MDLYALRILMIKLKRKLCKKKENILFVDVDGVICPIGSPDMNTYSVEAISHINRLINDYHLKVVLCSGRRQTKKMLSLTIKGLKKAGLKNLSETDVLLDEQQLYNDLDANRSTDIFRFLQRSPQINRFIIIDDQRRLYKNRFGFDRFVIVPRNPDKGFTAEDFNRATLFLSNGFAEAYRKWGKSDQPEMS